MRRIGSALLAAGLLCLPGCAPDPPPEVAGLTLALDDGRAWRVDDHTRRSAATMTALIRDAAPVASVEEARELAAAFDAELQELIAGCTMTGPAHDQLHSVLAALFPRITTLKTDDDLGVLRTTQQELRAVFEAYSFYFE